MYSCLWAQPSTMNWYKQKTKAFRKGMELKRWGGKTWGKERRSLWVSSVLLGNFCPVPALPQKTTWPGINPYSLLDCNLFICKMGVVQKCSWIFLQPYQSMIMNLTPVMTWTSRKHFYQRLLGFQSLEPLRTAFKKIHLAAEPLSPLIIILC